MSTVESGPQPKPQSGTRPPRLDATRVTAILLLLAALFSLPALRGPARQLDYLGNLGRFLDRFWPPNFSDFTVWDRIPAALVETLQIAVLATMAAGVLSLPLAAAASSNISPRFVVVLTRLLLNAIRSLPSLIWALVAVAVVGATPLAGVVALTCYSTGYLGKFFSDAFESVESGVAEGLRATGAGAVQAFQYGIWPHARPLVWSHLLWMLEYNIRAAAIVGYVGAGGIGVWLHTYQEYFAWDKFAAVLAAILALVVLLDFSGERLRSRLTE